MAGTYPNSDFAMTSIGYGVCVGSWDRHAQYVAPHTNGNPVLGISGQTSIAQTYNTILDFYASAKSDIVVILQHDDLEVTDPDAESKILDRFAAEADAALIGVAGGSARSGLAWWNMDPVGHQRTDSMMIDFGPRTGEVDLLEGSLLAFSPWAVRNLRFEPRPGFHSYDEIAMTAKSLGQRAVVVDIDTHHHTRVDFDSPASHDEWLEGDRWFRQKWSIG